jgi:hypothetical protein
MTKINFTLILLMVAVSLVKTEQVDKKIKSQKSSSISSSIAVNGLKPLPVKIHKRELPELHQHESEKIEKKFDPNMLKYLELQKYNRDLLTNELINNNRQEKGFNEVDDDEEFEENGEYDLMDEYEDDDDDQEEYYDDLIKRNSKSKRSSFTPLSQSNVNSNSLSTNNVSQRKKQLPLEKYKRLLINLVKQKNSLHNTMPIDTETFVKYLNDFYLSHHASKSNTGIVRPFKGSVLPTKDTSASRDLNAAYLLQKMKRAACGNLNGNPMHKWICW